MTLYNINVISLPVRPCTFEVHVRAMLLCLAQRSSMAELCWLHQAALQPDKRKLAGEATTYAKRLVEDSPRAVEGAEGLDVGDQLVDGGRQNEEGPGRTGDATFLNTHE